MKNTRSRPIQEERGSLPWEEEMQALRTMLDPVVAATTCSRDEVLEPCFNRGLLPGALIENFQMLRFVSRAVLFAQAAQRRFGVPASVLMAIGLGESGWNSTCLGRDAKQLASWFWEKGRELASRYPTATRLALDGDFKAYVNKLQILGYCSCLDAEDILGRIEPFNLDECDHAAILPPGQFDRRVFQAVRETSVRLELKPAMDLRDILPTLPTSLPATS